MAGAPPSDVDVLQCICTEGGGGMGCSVLNPSALGMGSSVEDS